MTPREIMEQAVASLPEGLPRPGLIVSFPGRLRVCWLDREERAVMVHVYYAMGPMDGWEGLVSMDGGSKDPLVLRAVAHVLAEVARLLEEVRDPVKGFQELAEASGGAWDGVDAAQWVAEQRSEEGA